MNKQTATQNFGPFDLTHLASHIGAKIYKNLKEISGTENIKISDVRSLKMGCPNTIAFVESKKHLQEFMDTKASACIVTEELIDSAPKDTYLLVVEKPYISYVKIVTLFYPTEQPIKSQSEFFYISPTAKLGQGSYVDFGCYIGENVRIGDNVKIHPNTYIGANVTIGDNCIIYNNVSIKNAVLGNNVIIHPGTTIGQDGFGYITEHGTHLKIPHLGKVIIGNDVEIGANTCIDRGTLDNTVIGDMCKLDNLVQIGHNVKLGKGCIIVSQTGIAGSTTLGNYVVAGGQSGLAGHISIGDMVQIAAKSGVISDLENNSTVIGFPAQPIREFWKQIAFIKKLTSKGKND